MSSTKWRSFCFGLNMLDIIDKRICLVHYFSVTRGDFTNFSRAVQNILLKFVYCSNCTSYENFKLKFCTCAQSHALGTHIKFQFEILTMNMISGVYFYGIILKSSRNVSFSIAIKMLFSFRF